MSIAETLQTLYKQYGELRGLYIECHKDLVALSVNNKVAKAEVFLQGAQIASYGRHGEDSLLFLSAANDFSKGSPLRGGIPICWPWFGSLQTNPSNIKAQYPAPFVNNADAHGFVRNRNWQVNNITTPNEELTVIELGLNLLAGTESDWPFAANLTYTIEIGKELTAYLQIQNTTNRSFSFTSALHTYFAVDDITKTSIHGLDGCNYVDTLKNWQLFEQEGDLIIDQEVDRIYHQAGLIQIIDGSRTININSQKSSSTVIWNPWIEKSQDLSQFNTEDFKRMLCVETANCDNDWVELHPNASHTLSINLR